MLERLHDQGAEHQERRSVANNDQQGADRGAAKDSGGGSARQRAAERREEREVGRGGREREGNVPDPHAAQDAHLHRLISLHSHQPTPSSVGGGSTSPSGHGTGSGTWTLRPFGIAPTCSSAVHQSPFVAPSAATSALVSKSRNAGARVEPLLCRMPSIAKDAGSALARRASSGGGSPSSPGNCANPVAPTMIQSAERVSALGKTDRRRGALSVRAALQRSSATPRARPGRPPTPLPRPTPTAGDNIRPHDRLGGLIHEYQHVA